MASFSVVSNISAAGAQANLINTNAGLQKAITRLSSGFRINQAGDDAAGLQLANTYRSTQARPPRGVARRRRERREPEDRNEAREPGPELRRVAPDVPAERVDLAEGIGNELVGLERRLAGRRRAARQHGERRGLPASKARACPP